MIDRNFVVAAAEKAMEGTDLFLVDVHVNGENEIEVEVDSMQRMSIDQCSELNRKIEETLDRDKEDFSLSVYSAGVGYPFKVAKQYTKAIGKVIGIHTIDGMDIEGQLLSVEDAEGKMFLNVSYDKKEKTEGAKRPVIVHHEDRIEVLQGMEIKEIITIK